MDLVLEDILNDLSPWWDFIVSSFEHTKHFFSWYKDSFLTYFTIFDRILLLSLGIPRDLHTIRRGYAKLSSYPI